MSVGDREADVYDLFMAERPAGVDLLVRAAWDRRVEQPRAVFVGHGARQAILSLRFGPVTLRPPRYRRAEKLPAVMVWAVSVVEEYPPAGGEPLEWLLLTTGAVPTVETAEERVDWYGVRFGIEVWHKVPD